MCICVHICVNTCVCINVCICMYVCVPLVLLIGQREDRNQDNQEEVQVNPPLLFALVCNIYVWDLPSVSLVGLEW